MGKEAEKKTPTLKQRIIKVMEDRKWKSQKQIREALGIKWMKRDHPNYYRYYNVNCELLRLVRSGHLIRAVPPDFLHEKARTIKYVYRYTGKEFILIYDALNSLKHANKFNSHHLKQKL